MKNHALIWTNVQYIQVYIKKRIVEFYLFSKIFLYLDYGEEGDQGYITNICSHECLNTPGSYICVCPENYHLHADKRTCILDFCEDLKDKTLNKTTCSHECTNNDDGFICACPEEFILGSDNKTCVEPIKCTEIQSQQCIPGLCSQTDQGYTCKCPRGFRSHGGRCIEIDECKESDHG